MDQLKALAPCRVLGLCFLLIAMLAIGCKLRNGNVSGTVKFDGKPLTSGTVTFFDEKNQALASSINPDGSFSISSVRPGRAKIAIAVPLPISFDSPAFSGISIMPPKADGPKIPDKYLNADTSGLTCNVRGGDQVFDIEMAP
jgi:hypothetical protein